MRLSWLVLVTALLAGCGGGSSGAGGSAVQPGAQSIALGVELGTEAASAATVLYAVEFTLRLPSGVTVAANASSGELSPGVLQAVDSAALAGGRYLPASAGSQATVTVNLADPGGFAVGSLATLNCSSTSQAALSGAGFTLEGFTARDAAGAPLPAVTGHFTVRAK
jgi:hypothetical protein